MEEPLKPLQSDCCGSGCTPCVFDIYEEQLKRWKNFQGQHRQDVQFNKHNDTDCMSQLKYSLFKLHSISKETKDTYVYRFEFGGNKRLNILPGQHLILKWCTADSSPISRQYTPVDVNHNDKYFDILIKLYENGPMSKFISTWEAGESYEWRGPFGPFRYIPNKWKALLLLTAGTGIAPMITIINTILENDDDETQVQLVCCVREYKDILLKRQLKEFSFFWNFKVVYFVNGEPIDTGYKEDVRWHRIAKDDISLLLSSSFDFSQTLVLICGTNSFVNDIDGYLNELGLHEAQYFRF